MWGAPGSRATSWPGLRHAKRTCEMFCHYQSGWASLDELEAHLTARRIE